MRCFECRSEAVTERRERTAQGYRRFRCRTWRVLGQQSYEVGDPVVPGEAGEQGDADVHHPLGLGDYDGAAPEPGQPVSLARVVPLDAMRLVLARIELPDRQEHVIDGVIIRTGEPRAPARQPRDQALAGGLVTTAALPVYQLP